MLTIHNILYFIMNVKSTLRSFLCSCGIAAFSTFFFFILKIKPTYNLQARKLANYSVSL